MLDINDNRVRWAQQLADKQEKQQILVANDFGGIDIKRQSSVVLVNNDRVLAIIEPKVSRAEPQWLNVKEFLRAV